VRHAGADTRVQLHQGFDQARLTRPTGCGDHVEVTGVVGDRGGGGRGHGGVAFAGWSKRYFIACGPLRWASLDVLNLLAHLLNQHFHVNGDARQLQAG
jgi:hypothetical protein